jgi:hypothetical protein
MATQHEAIVLSAMNGTQAAWLLLTLGTLRLGGYRLAPAANSNSSPKQT